MSSKSLYDILGWVALTDAVNAVKDGVPNPFPKELSAVRPENRIIGNSTKFNRTYGTRKAARVIKYGAAPRHRENQKEELVEVKLVTLGEQRIYDPYVLEVLRDYNSYDNANRAKLMVANNVRTMGTLFGNSHVIATATSLAYGSIWADSDGNVLPTSSGAATENTFSQQVPSANIGTVTDTASVGIFGASGGGSWALPGTDIPLQIRRIKELASITHGYEPKIAYYGKNIPSYMIANDFVVDYMARYEPMRASYLKDNTIPQGLFDLEWIPAWKAGMTKDDDTNVTLWPANGVTFTPGMDDLNAWYAMFEGSNLVPTTLDVQADAMAALAGLERVYGAFGYAYVNRQPLHVANVMGDTFLGAFKIPETIYIADVVA